MNAPATNPITNDSSLAPKGRPLKVWICVALVLSLLGLRLVNLGADTPPDFARISYGPYVDEGYKTSAARNRVLFGDVRWNPLDKAEDWSRISPLTNAGFEVAFRVAGTRLTSARYVTLIWFGALLLAVALALRRRYEAWILAGLLIAFGIEVQLMTFSRIALLVVPLALLSLLPVLGVASGRLKGPFSWGLVTVACLLVATLGVKIQAPAYFAGSTVGFLLWWWFAKPRSKSLAAALFVVVAVTMGLAGYAVRAVFLERLIGVAPTTSVWDIRFVLLNAMHLPSAFVLAAGYLGLGHLVLTRRKAFRSPYLCMLAGTMALGPLTMGVFAYDPIRYYAPIFPAFLLLLAEWVHLRPWSVPLSAPKLWIRVVALVSLGQGFLSGFQGLNLLLLERIPINLGRDPGLSDEGALLIGGPLGLIVALILLVRMQRLGSGRFLNFAICACGAFAGLSAVLFAANIFLFPSFESRDLAREIDSVIEEGESVGGDWAPFLVLDTEIPAVHLSWRNPVASLPKLQIDYYLHSESEIVGRNMWRDLSEGDFGFELGEPVLRSSYLGRGVRLYRLDYDD